MLIDAREALFSFIDDDRILVEMLDLREGVQHKFIKVFLIGFDQVYSDIAFVIIVKRFLLKRFVVVDVLLYEVSEEVLLEVLQVESASAVKNFLHLFFAVLLYLCNIFVDGLADRNEGAIINFEMILL